MRVAESTRSQRAQRVAQQDSSRLRGAVTARRVAWLGGALLLIAALVWSLGFSPLLGARTVTVRGAGTITAQTVRSAAQIRPNSPLLRLDASAIARRVEAIPEVESARVATSLPSTVVITVIERVAVGYVSATEGFILIDRTGRQYRAVAVAPAGKPQLIVPGSSGPDSVLSDAGVAAAAVAAALPVALLAKVTSIEATTSSDIELHVDDGPLVRWGDATRSQQKAALLPVLLGRASKLVDVSDPDQVFTR